jgi:hypothetical protein
VLTTSTVAIFLVMTEAVAIAPSLVLQLFGMRGGFSGWRCVGKQ